MALVSCPECGRQISTKAAACPQCGHPVGRPAAAVMQPSPDQTLNPEDLLGRWIWDDCILVFRQNGEFQAALESAPPWRANAWKGEWALKRNGTKLFIAQTHWSSLGLEILSTVLAAGKDSWTELYAVWLDAEIAEQSQEGIVFSDGSEFTRA